MALLTELVTICEKHRVDTGATLTVFARRLREAGRVSKAGRGRGAAHMTFLDAARFLIACAATDHPERAADAEFVFSSIVFADSGIQGDAFHLDATKAPTLDVGLSHLLEALADGTLDTAHAKEYAAIGPELAGRMPLNVSLRVSRSAVVARMNALDSEYHYHPATLAAVVAAANYDAQVPLMQSLDRETHRFRSGKNLIAELKVDLLRAVANLVAGKSDLPASPS